jgi:DNA transformation protein
MAADPGYLEHVLEWLAPIGGVTPRAMFGSSCLFHEGDMFGLISRTTSTLYFKVSDSNRSAYEGVGSEKFPHMPYYEVPADVLEDVDALQEWARIAIDVGHATATKKRR